MRDTHRPVSPSTSWLPVDRALAAYLIFVALVAAVYAAAIPAWPYLVVAHGGALAVMLVLPPRGAAWEPPRPDDGPWFARLRAVARFLRYTAPADAVLRGSHVHGERGLA